MKKRFYLFALLMAATTTVVFNGCKKDDDEPEDARNKFVAAYGVTENGTDFGGGQIVNYKFDISVTKSSTNSNDILISNFGNFGVTVKATVNGSAIIIPQQTQTILQQAVGVSGSGSISGSTFTFDYHLSAGSAGSDATDVCIKK